MKRTLSVISLALALVMLLGVFASCGDKEEETQAATGSGVSTEQETQTENNDTSAVTEESSETSVETESTSDNEETSTEGEDTVSVGSEASESTENGSNSENKESSETSVETESTSDNEGTSAEGEDTDSVGSEASESTESGSYSENKESSETSVETEIPSDNEETSAEGEDTSEDDVEPEYVEETYASLIHGENAEFIEYADRLANGVNAYFLGTDKGAYYFENDHMGLTHDLQDSKVVSSIVNKNGASYIENTMDVFIRMTDDSYYYASNSGSNATANIFRLGYYYYENRIEGLTFSDGYLFDDPVGRAVKFNFVDRYNKCVGEYVDGILKVTATDNVDPWLSFKGIKHKASDYNVLSVTIKVDPQCTTGCDIYFLSDNETFDNDHRGRFDVEADGVFHTYYVPISEFSGYEGNITGLRLDFLPEKGSVDATIEISDMRFLKATESDAPEGVYLNKMFNTYSNKLHQTLQIATVKELNNVKAIGIVTKIPEENVRALVVKDKRGLHYDLERIGWPTVEYVGFDIKNAGVFGFILPYDGSGGEIKVSLVNGYYVIEQYKTPANFTLNPSLEGTKNANDFYMGSRIYTDGYHSFDEFIKEAELEVNPLGEENFIVNTEESVMGSFVGYDALRGCYTLTIDGTGGFTPPFKLHPNRQYNVTFTVKGDGANDRDVYILALYDFGGSLECAAILDGNNMMLPIPLQVGKNFMDGGDCSIFNIDDALYSETILPMPVNKDAESTYTVLNLYYNWGKYPLKQISWIQYYAPYYHLSTGVHESNCITPYYFPSSGNTLNVLPDHRPMSGPTWDDEIQRTYAGTHFFLTYTDVDGNYYASENIKDTVGSYGPIYADLTMDYISGDGKIKVSYNHMEMPQTDENRAYYEMKYEILEDISFADFTRDFSFYSVVSLDPTGLYTKVGYLDTDNNSQVVKAANQGERFEYILGDNCPYFSFFDMANSTHPKGYSNLSFLIYKSSFVLGGEEVTPNFVVVNDYAKLSLTLELEEITLKAGDTMSIYAILMPWGSYEVYDEEAPDINVRRVRENSLLNPFAVTAMENCDAIESVFLPKVRTNDGKSATFTVSGGHNNVAIRVYGFEKLTAPVIEEYVGEEWVKVDISSFSTPDNYGYGYYYDGYGVYYDGDGTYSYAFVTTITEGAARTFRVTASEDFEPWPEIEKSPDPMNLWFDFQDISSIITSGLTLYGESGVQNDGEFNYVRIHRNGTDREATSIFFEDENGLLAGRYLTFKFRVPEGSASNIGSWQIYASTEHTVYDEDGSILIVGDDYNAKAPELSDGEWHVIVIDMEAYGKTDSFKKSDDGNYYLKYIRFDVFNPGCALDAYFDLAYVAVHDSLEEIAAYNKDLNAVALFTSSSSYEYISTKSDEEDPLDLYFDAIEIKGKIGHLYERFHSLTLSEKQDYISLAGATGAEAIIELFTNNTAETGRYLVMKYRIPEENPGQLAYWQFYLNTDGSKASDANVYNSTAVIADGEWQTVIFDLAARELDSFAPDENGKYTVKYFRFDFFNKTYSADVSYDIEYMAFSDSLEDIYSLESDMDFVTLCKGEKGTSKIDPKTGNEIIE